MFIHRYQDLFFTFSKWHTENIKDREKVNLELQMAHKNIKGRGKLNLELLNGIHKILKVDNIMAHITY